MIFLLAFGTAASSSAFALPNEARFVGPASSSLRAAVERALADAAARPDRKCADILDDAGDAAGRPISQADLHSAVCGYLESIRFADAEGREVCADGGVFAFTRPGAETIHLCGTRFAALEHTQPRLGTAVLLHEELHSLEFRENPPTPREIMRRILAACGTASRREQVASGKAR